MLYTEIWKTAALYYDTFTLFFSSLLPPAIVSDCVCIQYLVQGTAWRSLVVTRVRNRQDNV